MVEDRIEGMKGKYGHALRLMKRRIEENRDPSQQHQKEYEIKRAQAFKDNFKLALSKVYDEDGKVRDESIAFRMALAESEYRRHAESQGGRLSNSEQVNLHESEAEWALDAYFDERGVEVSLAELPDDVREAFAQHMKGEGGDINDPSQVEFRRGHREGGPYRMYYGFRPMDEITKWGRIIFFYKSVSFDTGSPEKGLQQDLPHHLFE